MRTGGLFSGIALAILGVAAPQEPPSWKKDYEQGLQVWRTPGRDRTPCVFCHSPDGIELAAYDFSDADIRRRAAPHLNAEGAEAVVKLIHAVRAKYGFKKLLDPMVDRPLQPGGQPLEGKTATDRDRAFVIRMERDHPELFVPVKSREDALRFHNAVRKLDVFEIPIGIELNRISEDRFRGREHATVAHWFSDTEFRPVISWDILFTVHDQYLEQPNDKAIGAMQDFAPQRLLELSTPADQMALFKYNSLNIFQHILRQRALGNAPFAGNTENLLDSVGRDYVPNPAWNLGELATQYADLDFKSFHFPETVVAAKTGAVAQEEQLRQMRVAWLYTGWMIDQGFVRRDVLKPVGEPHIRRTRLITDALIKDGPYPAHAAFVLARKTAIRIAKGNTDLDLGAIPESIAGMRFADRQHQKAFGRLFANVAKSCVWVSKDQSPTAASLLKLAESLEQ